MTTTREDIRAYALELAEEAVLNRAVSGSWLISLDLSDDVKAEVAAELRSIAEQIAKEGPPEPGPRSWHLVSDEPGTEVTAVRDAHGRLWHRLDELNNWCHVDDKLVHTHRFWSRLLDWCGPLTDATGMEG